MKKILLVAFILVSWLRVVATNYYFSTSAGVDTRTAAQAQNPATPWKTISKLNTIFTTLIPGDSALFKRGETFYGAITVLKSGTLASKIVIAAYGIGSQPTVTGFTPITGWVSVGTNLWESAANTILGTSVKIVTMADTLAPLGRYPNFSAANQGYLTYESHLNRNQITDNSLLNSPNWTGAQLAVRVNHFVTEVRNISSHVGTQVNISADVTDNFTDGMGFFFQASPLTLDQQGEWYYNPSTKKIRMYSTSMPANVQATSLSSLVRSTTFTNVTFYDLSFTGANDSCINIGVTASSGSGGNRLKVENCTINFTTQAIYTSQHSFFTAKGNTIKNSFGGAIYLSNADNSIVRRNIIDSTSMISGMGTGGSAAGFGIWTKGSDITIDSNSVIKTGYCGIKWDGDDNYIGYNFVDSFCITKNDGGGFYTHGGAGVRTNVRLVNNIALHGIGALAGGLYSNVTQADGIYLDLLASSERIEGNVVAYCEYGIRLNFGASKNLLRNNTLFNNKIQILINARSAQPTRNDTIWKNVLFSLLATQTTASYQSSAGASDIAQFGKIDSNYHARPILQTTIIKNISTSQNLPMFRSSYPLYEANGQISPVTISNVNQVQFIYNATFAPTVTPLTGGWKDVYNTSYSSSITLQPFTSVVLMSTGSLITPTITWANPSAITYGTALSGTQLNASTGIAGTFTYTPASGTILNGGTQSLSVLFTPTDQTTYSTASKTVTIVVNKAAATLDFSGATLTQTYTGLPLAPTVNTTPSGLSTVNILYNGLGQTPTNAGSKIVTAGLVNVNYSAPPISSTFVITKATATITVTTSLNQVSDGTPKVISSITNPLGLTTITTYAGSGTAPSLPGTYQVIKTINETNYQGADTSTLIITANSAAINITNLQQVYDGFNKPVTVTTIPAAQPYTITYNGSPTVAIAAGTYTVIATRNDLSGADTATLIVSKANPVITWLQPLAIPIGTALTSVQLNATANVAGSFVYSPDFGTIPAPGTQILNTTFTPTATNNYNTITKSVVISVYGNSNPSTDYYIRRGHIIYINSP